MPSAKPHRIPARPGQIRYLLSLEQFKGQEALARKLGTSTRYLRRMLTGARPGYKYSKKIWKLYESYRRKGAPQVPKKRIPKGTRGFVSMAAVVSVLQFVFQPTDAQGVPGVSRPWHDRETLYASTERKVRGKFDAWDGFSIVMVQGNTDQGVVSIKRYSRKSGTTFHEEKREEVEEVDSQTVDEMRERWATIPKKYSDVVSHLPIDDWLDEISVNVFSEPIFNLWVTRFSEKGELHSPSDPEILKIVESISLQAVEQATANTEDFQYDLIGVYAFSGWKQKPGRKPPRQR